jgi:hypothetical protein
MVSYFMQEHVMKYVILLVLLFCPLASDTYAWSRIGEADVQIRDGIVCFTVAKDEFRQSGGLAFNDLIPISQGKQLNRVLYFNGYSLYQKSFDKKDKSNEWGIYLDEPLAFRSEDCIQYGELPNGAKINSRIGAELPEKAPALKINVLYRLSFDATGGHAGTMFYEVKFCLNKDDNSLLVIKKVKKSCDE